MFRVYELVGPLLFVFWVYCVIEVILSRDDDVRNLPKVAWLLLVLLFPFAGGVAWFVAGRPDRRPRAGSQYEGSAPAFPEYDRPGRAAAASPEADEEFLSRIRERAEQQRRRAADEARRRDQQE